MAGTSADAGSWLLREDYRGRRFKKESEIGPRLKRACREQMPWAEGPPFEWRFSVGQVCCRCLGEKKGWGKVVQTRMKSDNENCRSES